ncbi:MAG: hypothetical protein AB2697_06025 [Candidatus Thiodiazotropha endolucinida]
MNVFTVEVASLSLFVSAYPAQGNKTQINKPQIDANHRKSSQIICREKKLSNEMLCIHQRWISSRRLTEIDDQVKDRMFAIHMVISFAMVCGDWRLFAAIHS